MSNLKAEILVENSNNNYVGVLYVNNKRKVKTIEYKTEVAAYNGIVNIIKRKAYILEI